MDIKDVVIDAYKTVGQAMLVGVSPAYEYENGKRTDNVIGYKYEVVMPQRAYDKISVKISGDLQIELPENETPFVAFEGLSLIPYWTQQGYRISASANSIRLVTPPKKAG